MTTSNNAVDPEKKEEKATTSADAKSAKQEVSLRELLENFTISLPIGEGGALISVRICPSDPHFYAAVEAMIAKNHTGVEWHFIQELYQASFLPLDQQQKKAEDLLNRYVIQPDASKETIVGNQTLNLSSATKQSERVKKAVEAKNGLDSFRAVLLEKGENLLSTEIESSLIAQRPVVASKVAPLRAAYEQDQKMSSKDKLMLPLRVVVCHALQEMAGQKSTKISSFQKTKNILMTRSNRVNSVIESSERKMQLMEQQLKDLLEASARPGANHKLLQEKFQELMDEHVYLIKAHSALKGDLKVSHPHMQKMQAFINIVSKAVDENNKLNAKDPKTLVDSITPENSEQVKKYMAPIEKRMREAEEKKATAQASPTVSKKT